MKQCSFDGRSRDYPGCETMCESVWGEGLNTLRRPSPGLMARPWEIDREAIGG
jgi:hypothetical protein